MSSFSHSKPAMGVSYDNRHLFDATEEHDKNCYKDAPLAFSLLLM